MVVIIPPNPMTDRFVGCPVPNTAGLAYADMGKARSGYEAKNEDEGHSINDRSHERQDTDQPFYSAAFVLRAAAWNSEPDKDSSQPVECAAFALRATIQMVSKLS